MHNPKRLKINLFTPAPTLLRRSGYAKARGSKLILLASLWGGVNEEPTKRSKEPDEVKINEGNMIPDTQIIKISAFC
jgi:hypothetical protein